MSENTATDNGGALHCENSAMAALNSVSEIDNNAAGFNGGGLHMAGCSGPYVIHVSCFEYFGDFRTANHMGVRNCQFDFIDGSSVVFGPGAPRPLHAGNAFIIDGPNEFIKTVIYNADLNHINDVTSFCYPDPDKKTEACLGSGVRFVTN